MDRVLAQNIPEAKRASFLKDNCDKIEEIGYMKPFNPEEITQKKDELSHVAIKINDIETTKKETLKDFKLQLDPLSEEKAGLMKDIKTKAEWVIEDCYQFINQEEKLVAYYNREGIMIASRPTKPEENQYTLRMTPKTGTDNT